MSARVPARLGAGALVIAALSAGVAITARAPDTETRERPFARRGTVGQRMSARTFDVTVLGARGAARIERAGRVRDTGGVFVVVRVRAVAGRKPTTIDHAAVRDGRGRTYLATPRITQPLAAGGHVLQPGIAVEGEIAFEVPRDAASSLTVLLADSSDTRMDAVVEVAVPIDLSAASPATSVADVVVGG